ncbi:MAG: hypothetical protein E2O68_03665 [Deltaproteobacteria bacterium]|nr:MAG: hypothetical protein E2O68_03665 [Deltaproteobacteria bacterium]
MDHVKVIYYGTDKKLTDLLNKEKVKCVDNPARLSFKHVLPDEKHLILSELILTNEMDLLLVDLSESKDIDQALRALLYELHLKNIAIIGLWNNLENPNLKKWRFELGISTHFCYWIRDPGSMEDLILGLTKFLGMANDKFTFYTKEEDKILNLSIPIRVNYFASHGLQVESDIAINENEIVNCYFPSIPNYPFTDFYVKSISRLNLSYPLEFQGTMENVFYDKFGQLYRSSFDNLEDLDYLELLAQNPVISKNLDENQVKSIIDSFNENKRDSKNKKSVLQRLVGKLSNFSDMDVLKNLVIDPKFTVYNTLPNPIWSYPYKFLLVSTLEDNLNILNTCGAQLITFVIHDKINPDEFSDTTAFVQLKTITSRLKNNYQKLGISPPQLQIYGLDIKSPDLINILDYENIHSFKESLEINTHLDSIRKFIKTPTYLEGINFYGQKLEIVSPKSYSEMSHGFLLREVKLNSISESEIIFRTSMKLEMNFSFMVQMNENTNIFATIYNIEEDEEGKIYYGLINSLNEKEKQNLRKLIIKG